MQHIDEGTLRRCVDEPNAATQPQADHLRACEPCRQRLAAFAADAKMIAGALGSPDDGGSDARESLSRFNASGRRTAPSAGALDRIADAARWKYRRYAVTAMALASAAAALLLLFFTPVGTAAQNFLTIFEPRQFVAIPVSRGEFQYMPNLDAFGTIIRRPAVDRFGRVEQTRTVATAAQAMALTGIAVRLPGWLPPSVPRTARFEVSGRQGASFIFSAAKARAFEQAEKRPMPVMPTSIDGSVLTLTAGPMVVETFGAPIDRSAFHRHRGDDQSDMPFPQLAIVQSAAPVVSSSGATARDIEGYLLSLPGISPQLAAEIRAIGDPSTTMPIPVPVDKAFAQNVIVDGVPALAVGDDTGVGGVIVWQKNGMLYGVAGTQRQRDLMEIAQSLH